jgi:Fe-S cluster assembly iron-binding protein IscA
MSYTTPINISGEAKEFLIEKIEKKNQQIQKKTNKYKYYLLKVIKIGENKYKYDLSFISNNYVSESKYLYLNNDYSIIIDKNSEEHLNNIDILLIKNELGVFLEFLGYRKKSLCGCTSIFEYVLPLYNENQLDLFDYRESNFKI